MSDRSTLVESGRAILALRLGGGPTSRKNAGPDDAKFALGDLLLGVADEELEPLAIELGNNLTAHNLRSYREVARAWPADQRVDASWTTHRTLAKAEHRFDLIQPKMTLREAQVANGKQPADTEHPSRWPMERRVLFIADQLANEATTAAVRQHLEERKRTRSASRTALKMADEDRSAEFREAVRSLREARDAKAPERAAYEALFKIREASEYVRAIGKATSEENSFLPDHQRPDLVKAVRDLAAMSLDVIAALRPVDPEATRALTSLEVQLDGLKHKQVASDFDGIIITGEVADDDARSIVRATTIDGELA